MSTVSHAAGYLRMRRFADFLGHLMTQYCLRPADLVFVEDMTQACAGLGIEEPDRNRPFRLVRSAAQGCRMLALEHTSDDGIMQRITAADIRSQTRNVATDLFSRLNSDRKKLGFLFLNEYATSLPEIGDDLLMADEWALKEMEALGFFRE